MQQKERQQNEWKTNDIYKCTQLGFRGSKGSASIPAIKDTTWQAN